MKIVIDIDGVIFEEKPTFERTLAKVIGGAPEKIQQLVAEGHTVILHTARGWAELEMTMSQLRAYKIPYTQLVMGKPIADVLVDDRSITSLDLLDKTYIDDEQYLKLNRQHIHETLRKHAPFEGQVVEVGPMDKDTMPYPEYYFDTRAMSDNYTSIGLDGNVDKRMNIIQLLYHFSNINTLIAMSVIEHVPELHQLPEIFYNVLAPEGKVILQTPFNLRFHGPRPDCWRITDDGYHALFDEYFNIELDIKESDRELAPASIVAIMRKK